MKFKIGYHKRMPVANSTYPQAGFRYSLDRKEGKVKY